MFIYDTCDCDSCSFYNSCKKILEISLYLFNFKGILLLLLNVLFDIFCIGSIKESILFAD